MADELSERTRKRLVRQMSPLNRVAEHSSPRQQLRFEENRNSLKMEAGLNRFQILPQRQAVYFEETPERA